MSSDANNPTYPNGFVGILEQMGKRLEPIAYDKGEALPPLSSPLGPLKAKMMDRDAPELGKSRSPYARKYRELAKEFHDQPALLHLHGLLIAHLRRSDQPSHTAALFCRLWEEESGFLLEHLDSRWLVSATTTFGDHGLTPAQRQLGHAMSILFNMMKLYESERLYSGLAPDKPYSLDKRSPSRLALQMDAFSLTGGGLDINMLGNLWKQSHDDPVMRPLAQRLLTLLIEDDKTVFRRLRTMRGRQLKKMKEDGVRIKPKKQLRAVNVPSHLVKPTGALQSWGVVSLVKAPLQDIARFAAFHLDLGATSVHLFLDAPRPDVADALSTNPRVHVTQCNDTYWAAQKRPRMKAHQQRQVWVATQAYQTSDLDWLAHIDVDEFLLPATRSPSGMQALLATVPSHHVGLRLLPAEMLAGTQGDELFKLLPSLAPKPVAPQDLYPNFGIALPHGFISHRTGKTMLRTGLDGIRFGVHKPLHDGFEISNLTPGEDAFIGHAHVPTWEIFRSNLDFRMKRGSYRKVEGEKFQLQDLLTFLQDEDGEDGLRLFFNEVCAVSDHLAKTLAKNALLLRHRLDLDAKVARYFGPLPTGADA